jgi:outer membrane murein-binding lipoprotein Lpp
LKWEIQVKKLSIILVALMFCSLILVSSIQLNTVQGATNVNDTINTNKISTQVSNTDAFTETTILSLEPEVIKVPYLGDSNPTIIAVNLYIHNVKDFKKVSFDMRYDSNIIEPAACEVEDKFYTTVSGTSGSYFGFGHSQSSHSFQIYRSFTGSATMFIFYFKALGTGSTQINFAYSQMYDDLEESIEHTAIGTTVEIVPFESWANTTCSELKGKYDQLTADFQTLNTTYHNLANNYNELSTDHDALNTDYATLELKRYTLEQHLHTVNTTYQNLLNDYDNLAAQNAALNESYASLEDDYFTLTQNLQTLNASYQELKQTYKQTTNDYEHLQANYTALEAEYNQIVADNNKLKLNETATNNASATANLMYLFMATTILFMATTTYFARRKTRKT